MIRCLDISFNGEAQKMMQINAMGGVALNTFGKRLKVMRIARGMSQVDLRVEMERFGVKIGETYISELERTKKVPMLDVAAAMAQALDVSVDYLAMIIDEALPYRRDVPQEPHYMSPEADEVAKLVDDMSASQRAIVADLTRGLASLPQTRQQRGDEFDELLHSVEAEFGTDMRIKFERFLRGRGRGRTE